MNASAGIGQEDNRGLVVFLVWKSLPYVPRMAVSALLILAGLAVQLYTGSFLAGLVPLAVGNLLLLVRGYDNRVDVERFSPGAEWEQVGRGRLDEVLLLDKSIRSWDRSIMDVTNISGAVMMVLVASILSGAALLLPGFGRVIALDAIVLLLPHWFTGVRRIMRLPKVVVRAEALAAVLDGAAETLGDDEVEIFMLLKGDKEVRLPDDIKFRVTFADQDPDFLGLYGQVVINDVQGRSYPYFYTVIVARKGYGLAELDKKYDVPEGMTEEHDTDAEVEFIVLRQETTKTSGYHTKESVAQAIFAEGYSLAQKAAGMKAPTATG